DRPIRKAQRVGIAELRDLADMRGEAQQELRPGVKRSAGIHRGAALQGRQRAVETKGPARRAEGSALRLEVVQRVFVVFKAEAQRMRPLHFADVDVGRVLVVPELERAAGISVADVRDAAYLKRRDAR